MALELESINTALEKISHYKVNRKIYDLMKTIDNVDIIYRAEFDALLLNGKPVFVDNELKDGIDTYEYKEPEINKPINTFDANIIAVRPLPIRPITIIGLI